MRVVILSKRDFQSLTLISAINLSPFFGLFRLQPDTASRYLRSYVDVFYPLCSLGKSLLVALTRAASVCHFYTSFLSWANQYYWLRETCSSSMRRWFTHNLFVVLYPLSVLFACAYIKTSPFFSNNNPKNRECRKLEFSTLSTGFQQQVAQRNSS